ncbi:MAG: TraB/GumN family protein [Comamonadaceae bacterium]|nr:TraB/GumN family protein [Comamonadaceae bacterium]
MRTGTRLWRWAGLLGLLLSLPLAAAAADCRAVAPERTAARPNDFGKGLLWRIDNAGAAPSYLFGTFHTSDPRITVLPCPVERAFDSAASYTMEVIMNGAGLVSMAEAMFFSDGRKLEDVLGSELYQEVVAILSRQDAAKARAIRHMKPWAVMMAFSGAPGGWRPVSRHGLAARGHSPRQADLWSGNHAGTGGGVQRHEPRRPGGPAARCTPGAPCPAGRHGGAHPRLPGARPRGDHGPQRKVPAGRPARARRVDGPAAGRPQPQHGRAHARAPAGGQCLRGGWRPAPAGRHRAAAAADRRRLPRHPSLLKPPGETADRHDPQEKEEESAAACHPCRQLDALAGRAPARHPPERPAPDARRSAG